MINKLLFSGFALALLMAITYWHISDDSRQTASVNTQQEPDSTLSHDVSLAELQNSTNSTPSAAMPDPNTIPISEPMSGQVEDALLQYEELSKYPPNSQPILSEQHVHSFVNTSSPQAAHPFPFDDLETPIQLALELDQFNYFFGDAIQAELTVGNVPEQSSFSARAVLTDLAGDVLAETSNLDISNLRAKIVFDTQAYASENWPLEMNLGAYVDLDGHQMFISAPFRINTETAEMDSVGYSEPVAENLLIPVKLNVTLPGYYFVAGILYSQTTGKPLIHLEAEGPLSEGLSSLQLKAHIQALKKAGDEGPYYLDKIRIERWSDEQIPRDVAGKVPAADYSVQGYSFKDYQDLPYIDPLAEERKRLMQGLSAR